MRGGATKTLERAKEQEIQVDRQLNRLLDREQAALQAREDTQAEKETAKRAIIESGKLVMEVEAMKTQAEEDQAHNLIDEEKTCILLKVTNANSKCKPLKIQWAMQAQWEFVLGISKTPQPPAEADTQTGVAPPNALGLLQNTLLYLVMKWQNSPS